MRRLLGLALAAAALLAAQGLDSLSGWQFYRELSPVSGAGPATLALDAGILANIREDAADLRLFDAAGKELPYELRILRAERRLESREAAELRRGTDGDSAEIILDLGENPPPHNQVQVDTEGTGFRRKTAVFASGDAQQWTPLNENGMILRLAGKAGSASIDRVQYPSSESRYLRVTVARDDQTDSGPPVIQSVAVQRIIEIQGEEQVIPAASVTRETVVEGQGSISRYAIDLPGRIPLHALRFNTSAGPFVRTYQLQSLMGDHIAPSPVSAGRLGRGAGAASNVVGLRFQEVFARQLQLTIADGGDAPLEILEPAVLTASRQLIVDLGAAQPLRLYYGNPSAAAPDYDFKAGLPLDESAPRFELGPQQLNPAYAAPPAPLYERAPWLIYVLTAAASLALLAILRSLVFDVDR